MSNIETYLLWVDPIINIGQKEGYINEIDEIGLLGESDGSLYICIQCNSFLPFVLFLKYIDFRGICMHI